MSNQEVFESVRTLISNLFDLDEARITPESTFESLDLTSLDAIDLIVELQTMTGKKVNEESAKKIRTVGDIVALVEAAKAGDEAKGDA
ncbi:MAG: phosphopantetheine-binding protein [Myxococcales bacterium]|jgi:acyl carrier protein|nr:phosphopantetheine-binding protein [Myxococcales bacterium]